MSAVVALALIAASSDVYILAGQSNMSGRGDIADLTPAERAPDPRIRLYANDGRWRVATEPLDDATGQLDAVSADPRAAVGPGLFFARALDRPVVLVPCAKGGSAIAQWRPDTRTDTLYGSCLARARAAGGRIAGVLWYQGETDARDTAAARRWSAAFADLARAFRRDLAAPRLPFAVVRLADAPARAEDTGRYPGWTIVQDAQARLRIDCVTVVRANGLPRLADDLHLTTAAHRVLGVRLADAMRRQQRRCR